MTGNSFFRDARARMLSGVPEYADLLKNIREERKERRAAFISERGIKELAHICVKAGVFSQLDEKDPASIGAHNLVVDMLDDMGLLDEANMESIIGYMLSLPLIPGEEQ